MNCGVKENPKWNPQFEYTANPIATKPKLTLSRFPVNTWHSGLEPESKVIIDSGMVMIQTLAIRVAARLGLTGQLVCIFSLLINLCIQLLSCRKWPQSKASGRKHQRVCITRWMTWDRKEVKQGRKCLKCFYTDMHRLLPKYFLKLHNINIECPTPFPLITKDNKHNKSTNNFCNLSIF